MRARTKIIAGLLVAVVIIGWPVGAHFYAKHKVAAYRRQLITQGEKMTIAELVPPWRAGSDDAANSFLSATWQAGSINYTNLPPTMRAIALGRALVAWQQEILPTDDSTNVWPELRDDLESKNDALAGMRAALEKPVLAVNLDYSQGFNLPSTHLIQFKAAAQWLSAAAMLELHDGHVTSATQNLHAMAALASHWSTEPRMISSLVRIAIAAITINAVWEALQSPDLSDEQLAELQADWESVDFLTQAESALSMERAMGEKTFTESRQSHRALTTMMSGRSSSAGLAELAELGKGVVNDPGEGLKEIIRRYPGYAAWKCWWSYEDELAYLQFLQADLVALREVQKEKCFGPALDRCEQTSKAIRKAHPKAGSWLGDFPGSSFPSYLFRLRRIETQRHLLVAAVVLKRHQLRHGDYPSDLAALAPEFLAASPSDPIDGQPLRYRLQPDGSCLLYSVGEDGVDDGGNPKPSDEKSTSLVWMRGRDWIWPQPARAKEIEAYRESMTREYLSRLSVGDSSNSNMSGQERTFRERYGLPLPPIGPSTNAPATNRP